MSQPDPIIQISDLVKIFGTQTVLSGVNLAIMPGETMVIMGGSGSGKSTMLRHMIGSLTPNSGSVMLFGERLDQLDEDGLNEVRKKFGILFQSGALFNSMTIAENVALPLQEHTPLASNIIDTMVKIKLELVGLREHADKYPAQISGGMKKRAGLARALALDPKILFYDEPSAGLDPVTSAEIDRLIVDLTEKMGVTSVVVTHEMDSAFAVANRMAMLDKGRMLMVDKRETFEELRDWPEDKLEELDEDRQLIRQFLRGDPEGPITRRKAETNYAEDLLGTAEPTFDAAPAVESTRVVEERSSMPSLKERHRNNIRTGVFVSTTILLALAVVVVLSGGLANLTRSTKTYVAAYRLADGISNLKGGADVRVGGLSMGTVAGIAPNFTDDSLESILVTFELDGRITLREGAEIYVKGALIGSDAWIEIPNLGDPEGAALESSVDGTSPVGLLASVLGPDSAERTHQILDDTAGTMANANSITRRIDDAFVQYDDRIIAILDDLGLTAADLKDLMASVEASYENEWAVQLNQLMAWTGEFTGRLDETVGEGQRLVTSVNTVVDDNKAQLAKIVDHADVTAEQIETLLRHLNDDTIKRADDLLARAQEGVDGAADVIGELNARKSRWSADLSDAFANANLMSTQLRLVAEEVRRNPWKLLHRPTDDELEHELLYAAARSFAVATADLKAASASAKSLLDGHGDRLAEDSELRARLEQDVIGSVDRYKLAQEKLLAVIFQESP